MAKFQLLKALADTKTALVCFTDSGEQCMIDLGNEVGVHMQLPERTTAVVLLSLVNRVWEPLGGCASSATTTLFDANKNALATVELPAAASGEEVHELVKTFPGRGDFLQVPHSVFGCALPVWCYAWLSRAAAESLHTSESARDYEAAVAAFLPRAWQEDNARFAALCVSLPCFAAHYGPDVDEKGRTVTDVWTPPFLLPVQANLRYDCEDGTLWIVAHWHALAEKGSSALKAVLRAYRLYLILGEIVDDETGEKGPHAYCVAVPLGGTAAAAPPLVLDSTVLMDPVADFKRHPSSEYKRTASTKRWNLQTLIPAGSYRHNYGRIYTAIDTTTLEAFHCNDSGQCSAAFASPFDFAAALLRGSKATGVQAYNPPASSVELCGEWWKRIACVVPFAVDSKVASKRERSFSVGEWYIIRTSDVAVELNHEERLCEELCLTVPLSGDAAPLSISLLWLDCSAES